MAPVSFNSNISSARVQRYLSEASSSLSRTFERLSSGMRINQASDDAAGLAVSSTLNASSRVYQQGVRNINDAISLLNIADGALDQLSGVVTRMRELAYQSSNGTFSVAQRRSLNEEGEALSLEFNRIVASTSFNGLSLLNGSLDSLGIQLGFGDSARINVNIGDELSRTVGTGTFSGSDNVVSPDSGALASADFNGDGIVDLAAGDTALSTVRIHLGQGDGTFTPSVTAFATGAIGRKLEAADVNNDGKVDLVVVSGVNVRVFHNDGSAGFKPFPMAAETPISGMSTMTAFWIS